MLYAVHRLGLSSMLMTTFSHSNYITRTAKIFGDVDENANSETEYFKTSEADLFSLLEMLKPGKKAPVPPIPFSHRINLNFLGKVKILFGAIFILPVRAILITLTLLVAWGFAYLGTIGLTLEKNSSTPHSKPRRIILWINARVVMRIAFFFAGFYWVKIKGSKAKSDIAPILVVVPHTSVFDALPLILLGGPTIVARSDVHRMPLVGKLVDLTQPIYVRRENPSSRNNAIKEIVRRVKSSVQWPQIMIFPEGTCTNHSCLAKFKIGAFFPGVPIQPVIVRWPNRCDSTTWTFDGISTMKVLFFTFCQFINYFELEYLPIYYPDENEQQDPKIYASNMQSYLADVMKIPATDYEYIHGMQLTEMRNSKLPETLAAVAKLYSHLRQLIKTTEVEIAREILQNQNSKWVISLVEAASMFGLTEKNAKVLEKLFQLYDLNRSGKIDLREYFTHVFLLNPSISPDKISMIVFVLYGDDKMLEREVVLRVLRNVFFISETRARALVDKENPMEGGMIDLIAFEKIMGKHFDFVKLFAMEVTGGIKSLYMA